MSSSLATSVASDLFHNNHLASGVSIGDAAAAIDRKFDVVGLTRSISNLATHCGDLISTDPEHLKEKITDESNALTALVAT